MVERPCRMCRQTSFPLAPFGYCYLCPSRFGTATQVAMLAMAFNPSLTVADLQRFMGIESASLAKDLWECVSALIEEERGRGVVVEDCRVHTRNSHVFLTVSLAHPEATTGMVWFGMQWVRVYLVAGSQGREWATSLHLASYWAHVGKRKGEQA